MPRVRQMIVIDLNARLGEIEMENQEWHSVKINRDGSEFIGIRLFSPFYQLELVYADCGIR